MDAIYVGIDVSKDRLDVHVRPTDEQFAVANDEARGATLVHRLAGLRPTLIVLEATGGYEEYAEDKSISWWCAEHEQGIRSQIKRAGRSLTQAEVAVRMPVSVPDSQDSQRSGRLLCLWVL